MIATAKPSTDQQPNEKSESSGVLILLGYRTLVRKQRIDTNHHLTVTRFPNGSDRASPGSCLVFGVQYDNDNEPEDRDTNVKTIPDTNGTFPIPYNPESRACPRRSAPDNLQRLHS